MNIYRYIGKNNAIGRLYIKFAYYPCKTSIELFKNLYVKLNNEEKLRLLLK